MFCNVEIWTNGKSVKLVETMKGVKTLTQNHRFTGINKWVSLNQKLHLSGFRYHPDDRALEELPHPHEIPYLERFSKAELIKALERSAEECFTNEITDTDSTDTLAEDFGTKETWLQIKFEEWLTN